MASTSDSDQLSTMQPGAKSFMDLPAELRVKIYKEVFAKIKVKQTAAWPDRLVKPLKNEDGQPLEEPIFRYRFSPHHPLAILSVSQQISREARPVLESCPILIESFTSENYPGNFQINTLPTAAKRQVYSIVADIDPMDSFSYEPFLCAVEQYTNLRKAELNGGFILVSVPDHTHQRLLDTKVHDLEDSDEIYDRAMQEIRRCGWGKHLLHIPFTVKLNLVLTGFSTRHGPLLSTGLLGTIVFSHDRVQLANLMPWADLQKTQGQQHEREMRKRRQLEPSASDSESE
ncbi:hypothetical protein H2200_005456 [Cladophialophora chaetospira]|uniref:Uncharacterized protein n=1 Tax=Cladophialophora chaetospira TaxID=386627 RepID=A0AA39CIY2_9EURO|nr:hypothetical protein H2200_005456 [Cladophialophora chaetospira]